MAQPDVDVKQAGPAMNSERATQALQTEFVKYVFDKNAPGKTLTADELHASSKFNPSGLDGDWLKQARSMLHKLDRSDNSASRTLSPDAIVEKAMLTRLLKQSPEQREEILQGFRANDSVIAQMSKSKELIRDQVSHGSLKGGILEQVKVVALSEKLDPKPLSLELACLEDAIKSSNGSANSELIARQNVVTQLLAAPFMERVRLGLFESKNNQSYDAENMFKQALTVAVRPEVHSPEISDLRQAVAQKAHGLEVERELPDLFRKNFSQLAANSSKKVIVQDDLARAASAKQVDPVFVEFLTQNYKVLNGMSHGMFDWSDGITQAGVDAYQAKYGPKMFN